MDNDFLDIDFGDYLKIDALSKTSITAARRSLAHYHAMRTDGIPETEAMAKGTAAHAALLEPERFSTDYVVIPESLADGIVDAKGNAYKNVKATAEYKRRLADFTAKHPTAIFVDEQSRADFAGMRDAINGHGMASELVGRLIVREGSLLWSCPTTGAACKARFDGVSEMDGQVVGWDYKVSSRPIDVRAWTRQALALGYHIGAAHYCDGFSRVTGERLDRFIFLVQESTRPYGIRIFEFDRATFLLGVRQRLDLIRAIQSAEKDGWWPGYSENVELISAPDWAFEEDLEATDD